MSAASATRDVVRVALVFGMVLGFNDGPIGSRVPRGSSWSQ